MNHHPDAWTDGVRVYPAVWVRPPGLVLGQGGRGTNPGWPTCPICGCYGGGGHGGLCPNMDRDPEEWIAERPPEPNSLTPESTHKRMAADASANADALLRLAREDGHDDDQMVQMIEAAADQLAQAAATLRVISRWLLAKQPVHYAPERGPLS